MNEHPHSDDVPTPNLRDEAPAHAQAQAAREQSIERTQDEIDAAAIDREPPEPEDALDLTSQKRLFEQPTRRGPHA
jgi:hypothetical protein